MSSHCFGYKDKSEESGFLLSSFIYFSELSLCLRTSWTVSNSLILGTDFFFLKEGIVRNYIINFDNDIKFFSSYSLHTLNQLVSYIICSFPALNDHEV